MRVDRGRQRVGADVGNVWGIGRRITARLNEGGIRSVADLLRADPTALRRQFSVGLEKTLRELRGTICLGLDDEPAARQQIMCSRSFGAPATELSGLAEVVSQFAARVAEKVRQQQAVAGAVQVFISTSPFRANDRQHSPSVTMPLVRPTDDTRTLIAAAVRALRGMFRPGFNYLKAGVMLVDLQPKGREQAELDLFSAIGAAEEGVRHDPSPLMATVDALNRRFGRGAVSVGSASSQVGGGAYAGKRERRSPRYTTRLDEIPVASAR